MMDFSNSPQLKETSPATRGVSRGGGGVPGVLTPPPLGFGTGGTPPFGTPKAQIWGIFEHILQKISGDKSPESILTHCFRDFWSPASILAVFRDFWLIWSKLRTPTIFSPIIFLLWWTNFWNGDLKKKKRSPNFFSGTPPCRNIVFFLAPDYWLVCKRTENDVSCCAESLCLQQTLQFPRISNQMLFPGNFSPESTVLFVADSIFKTTKKKHTTLHKLS